MKFRVTMKTPDSLEYFIRQELLQSLGGDLEEMEDREELQRSEEFDAKEMEILNQCEKWFRFNEILTVEIDTEKGTCVVVENS